MAGYLRAGLIVLAAAVVQLGTHGCEGEQRYYSPGAGRPDSESSPLLPDGGVGRGNTGETALGTLGFSPGSLGSACGEDAACDSGFCASGRCCETACDGTCEACSASGQCNTAPIDDARCPPIPCGATTTTCAQYATLQAANRCAGPGECKTTCDPISVAVDVLCEEVAPGLRGQCDERGDCVDPRAAAGASCASSISCSAGSSCVDGVCCKEACGSACETCDAQGECQADAAGTGCGDGRQCFGRGVCLAPSGSACSADAECGSGNCEPAVGGGSVCCVEPCTGGSVCSGDGVCVSPESDLGGACAGDEDCVGGRCFDGVCCDSECGTACERCNIPGQVGRCTAEAVGAQDPLCPAGLECAGRGQCLRALGTTCTQNGECRSGACTPALEASGSICCATACPEGQRCGANGSCAAAPLPNGSACTQNDNCSSNACVSGRCCESACNGLCQACSALGVCNASPGNDLRCAPVDCPTSNTVCVTYPPDVATNLCAAFGNCRSSQQDCRPTFAQAGQACEVIGGVQGQCDGTGNCRDPRVGAGSLCTSGAQCTSGLCVSGVCRELCRLVADGATEGSRYDSCVLTQ
ncbi:MAG: hypothetical protein RL685_4693 [Pseudomonadota bacterium]